MKIRSAHRFCDQTLYTMKQYGYNVYHIIYCVIFSDNCIQPEDGQKQYLPKHVVDTLCIIDNYDGHVHA